MKLFGTDGIRDIVNRGYMSVENIVRLGRAYGRFIVNSGVNPSVVVGRDTRESGSMIEYALMSGILSEGVDVHRVGVMTTPGISLLVRKLGFGGGVVISASHNPFFHNGIKFFSFKGEKLNQTEESSIEELFFHLSESREVKLGEVREADGLTEYVRIVLSMFSSRFNKHYRIAVDCAHGATYKLAPTVLRELGMDVMAFNVEPTGKNINDGCGSLSPEFISMKVKETGADMGFAFDGDGDRIIIADRDGRILDGDNILLLLARYFSLEGCLKNRTVVGTVMTNIGLEEELEKENILLVRAKVGDKYVWEQMKRRGAVIGGEPSGHIIINGPVVTGDGILTGLFFLKAVEVMGIEKAYFSKYPQKIVNIHVNNKTVVESEELRAYVALLMEETTSRILIRPSGTEPVVRVMVEDRSEGVVDDIIKKLVERIKRLDSPMFQES